MIDKGRFREQRREPSAIILFDNIHYDSQIRCNRTKPTQCVFHQPQIAKMYKFNGRFTHKRFLAKFLSDHPGHQIHTAPQTNRMAVTRSQDGTGIKRPDYLRDNQTPPPAAKNTKKSKPKKQPAATASKVNKTKTGARKTTMTKKAGRKTTTAGGRTTRTEVIVTQTTTAAAPADAAPADAAPADAAAVNTAPAAPAKVGRPRRVLPPPTSPPTRMKSAEPFSPKRTRAVTTAVFLATGKKPYDNEPKRQPTL